METDDMMQSGDDSGNPLFETAPVKFAAMSLCTFGLYEAYWSYKNWRFIKKRDESDLRPFWRAAFYPLWHYSLLTELNKSLESSTLSSNAYCGLLASIVFILNAAVRLPDPYWLVSTLTFLGFLPALLAMRKAEPAGPIQQHATSFHPANLLAYFVGGPAFAFGVLSTIGFFPSTAVIAGDDLWDRDITYLREAEILGPDEAIELFYSAGMWSIAEDGQFISNEYVTSYYRDPDDGELYTNYASYLKIDDINVVWAEGVFDVTIATITTGDEYQFQLLLSSESDGDRKFVAALREHWNQSRKAD